MVWKYAKNSDSNCRWVMWLSQALCRYSSLKISPFLADIAITDAKNAKNISEKTKTEKGPPLIWSKRENIFKRNNIPILVIFIFSILGTFEKKHHTFAKIQNFQISNKNSRKNIFQCYFCILFWHVWSDNCTFSSDHPYLDEFSG